MAELNDELYSKMTALTDEGNEFQSIGQLAEAKEKFKDAFQLLPDDHEEWDAATWILVALGDVCFLMQDYREALEYLQSAMHCPDALGNPFIHMRFGQVQFELGNEKRAADEVTRAYMGDGMEIFADEDPKYVAFLKTRIKLG